MSILRHSYIWAEVLFAFFRFDPCCLWITLYIRNDHNYCSRALKNPRVPGFTFHGHSAKVIATYLQVSPWQPSLYPRIVTTRDILHHNYYFLNSIYYISCTIKLIIVLKLDKGKRLAVWRNVASNCYRWNLRVRFKYHYGSSGLLSYPELVAAEIPTTPCSACMQLDKVCKQTHQSGTLSRLSQVYRYVSHALHMFVTLENV